MTIRERLLLHYTINRRRGLPDEEARAAAVLRLASGTRFSAETLRAWLDADLAR